MEEEELYFGGIDVGLKGAISILLPKPGPFDVFTLVDMFMVNGWYDPLSIQRVMNIKRLIVGIEESYRFPKLCKGIGVVWACAKLSFRVEEIIMVRPQAWQRHFKIKKADKEISLKIARKLFPGQHSLLTRKMDHNRAESLLIASYVRSLKNEKDKSTK